MSSQAIDMPNPLTYCAITARDTPRHIQAVMGTVVDALEEHGWVPRRESADGPHGRADDISARYWDAAHFSWPQLRSSTRRSLNGLTDQILGTELDTPCDLILYWKRTDGLPCDTDHALRVAHGHEIECIRVNPKTDTQGLVTWATDFARSANRRAPDPRSG